VYGVVRADHPRPDVKGVGSPPGKVRLVRSGPLAAAETVLPDDFVVQDEDGRAHLKVLTKLLANGPVVPLRMGTVAQDEAAVRTEVLDAARPALVERLDALDGLVEVHVDADDDEAEAITDIARAAGLAPAVGDMSARLDLGRQVAELLVEKRQQLAEEIVAELRPFAVHDVPRSMIRSPEDPVLRWAFLVRRDAIDQFDDAVIAVRSHHPTTSIRHIGPLPPSHFIDWHSDAEADADSFSAPSSWGW
jgi:hypothetical protein